MLDEEVKQLIPKKWREKVNEQLGKGFEMTIEDSDGGNFRLLLGVPEKYDCRNGDEKRPGTKDIRACFVRRASDIQDIEDWCKRIKINIQKTYPQFK